MPNEKGTSVYTLQKKFQNVFGFTLPLFHGRGLLNCTCMTLETIILLPLWTFYIALISIHLRQFWSDAISQTDSLSQCVAVFQICFDTVILISHD